MTEGYILDLLSRLPYDPGVYLMKNTAGDIIYVGKAASLHKRVKSYFSSGKKLSPKVHHMVGDIADIDFLVTSSEQEALILELNLIKQHRPRYNVSLKDDKSFPYIKVDMDSEWPRVYVTRRLEQDGGRYFGPFTSARSVRHTLRVIKEIFPVRSCKKTITGKDSRPCLKYYIKRCPGPCIGAVSREEYAGVIRQIILFLEGKQEKVIREVEDRMKEAAGKLDFERAALLRDRIRAVREVIEAQKLAARVSGEQDVIAFAGDEDRTCTQVFFVRNGRLVGRESFILEGTRYEEPSHIMTSFLEQFYHTVSCVPPLLLLQHPPQDRFFIQNWLRSRRGGKVRIYVPRRGSRKLLVDTVAENARQGLEQIKIRQMAAPGVLESALEEIKRELDLPDWPARLEGYDISDIQGMMAVGSLVVFEGGRPKRAAYRRFRIKTVPEADDYAMLAEVVSRRFRRLMGASGEWAAIPDLILIDGGKGQLNAVLGALERAGVGPLPVVGIAKENEAIFIPDRSEPVMLPRSSAGLQLLERVRDEAHRFAVSYHRKVRNRSSMASGLDAISGIGIRRRRALLRHFGSLGGVRRASIEELASVYNMNWELAKRIKEQL